MHDNNVRFKVSPVASFNDEPPSYSRVQRLALFAILLPELNDLTRMWFET